jgi:hypothetical protein
MSTCISNALRPSRFVGIFAACILIAFSGRAADHAIIVFQAEPDALSENAKVLIGHWRKTTVVFESPRDENLVLHPDGTAEKWIVTASERSEARSGRWSVQGKTLKLLFGEDEVSRPFTIYEGQLVFPNIPNRRQFWEKIE